MDKNIVILCDLFLGNVTTTHDINCSRYSIYIYRYIVLCEGVQFYLSTTHVICNCNFNIGGNVEIIEVLHTCPSSLSSLKM